jgi:hypothetical protein
MAALALALALLLAGCPATPRPEDEGPVLDGGELEERSDLFVAGVLPGETVFATSDSRFCGLYGYTLWALAGTPQEPFVAREARASKISGDGAAGYGLVFCAYESGDPVVGETMLVIMINTESEFIVGEIAGAGFRVLIPWTRCAALKGGYGQENRISLAAQASEIVVSLNGSEAARFRDDDPPLHDSGADGYLVVISPLDRLPEVPVHVVFREGP